LGGERRLLADPRLFDTVLQASTDEIRRVLVAQAVETGQAKVLARQLAAVAHPKARSRFVGLRIGGYSREQRVNALATFRLLSEVVDIEPFIVAMWDPCPQVRGLAAGALSDIASRLSEDSPQREHVKYVLTIALRHHTPAVRGAAAQGMAHFRQVDVVDTLLDRLDLEDDMDVLGQVARSLGSLGDPRAVKPLLSAHQAGRLDRGVCCEALAQLGESAVETLVSFARRRNVNTAVRFTAIAALVHIGDPRAIEPLVALAGRSSECQQVRAIATLLSFWLQRSAPLTISQVTTRRASDEALPVASHPQPRPSASLLEHAIGE
jgi:hypothetical protein